MLAAGADRQRPTVTHRRLRRVMCSGRIWCSAFSRFGDGLPLQVRALRDARSTKRISVPSSKAPSGDRGALLPIPASHVGA